MTECSHIHTCVHGVRLSVPPLLQRKIPQRQFVLYPVDFSAWSAAGFSDIILDSDVNVG
jgi:hypothetical protein